MRRFRTAPTGAPGLASVRVALMVVTVAVASFAGCAGCATREERTMHERHALVQGFDAIMQAGEGRRDAPLAALRALVIHDTATRRTQTTCLRMFDAVARASSLQRRLEPMSAEVARLGDAGLPVPSDRRSAMLVLYRDAVAATDVASRQLRPCTQGIDRIRAHPDRAE